MAPTEGRGAMPDGGGTAATVPPTRWKKENVQMCLYLV